MAFKAGLVTPDLSLIPTLLRRVTKHGASAATAPKLRFGKKKVYMPSFSVAMHRTPQLGPGWAKFSVPLWFSKLDLRDYLYHIYNVPTLRIRSYVKLGEVSKQRRIPGQTPDSTKVTRRWHRSRSTKVMTAELVEPFVWPKEGPNADAFFQDSFLKQEKEGKTRQKAMGTLADAEVDEVNREHMQQQYDELKKGAVKWTALKAHEPVLAR